MTEGRADARNFYIDHIPAFPPKLGRGSSANICVTGKIWNILHQKYFTFSPADQSALSHLPHFLA